MHHESLARWRNHASLTLHRCHCHWNYSFSIWKQFPTTIVGFSQYVRMHGHMPTFQECTKEPNSQQWYYSAECHNSESNKVYNGPKPFPVASIALDSAMFFHKMCAPKPQAKEKQSTQAASH